LETFAFRWKRYGSNLSPISTSGTLDWDSPNSREIPHGSRSTATIVSLSLICVRTVRERHAFTSVVLHFFCHRDAAAVVETHWRPEDVVQDKVAHITVHQYRVNCCRHRKSTAFRSILLVRIIRSQLSPAVRRLYRKPDRVLYLRDNAGEKCVTPFDDECPDNRYQKLKIYI
jgi:hypothetical protein